MAMARRHDPRRRTRNARSTRRTRCVPNSAWRPCNDDDHVCLCVCVWIASDMNQWRSGNLVTQLAPDMCSRRRGKLHRRLSLHSFISSFPQSPFHFRFETARIIPARRCVCTSRASPPTLSWMMDCPIAASRATHHQPPSSPIDPSTVARQCRRRPVRRRASRVPRRVRQFHNSPSRGPSLLSANPPSSRDLPTLDSAPWGPHRPRYRNSLPSFLAFQLRRRRCRRRHPHAAARYRSTTPLNAVNHHSKGLSISLNWRFFGGKITKSRTTGINGGQYDYFLLEGNMGH